MTSPRRSALLRHSLRASSLAFGLLAIGAARAEAPPAAMTIEPPQLAKVKLCNDVTVVLRPGAEDQLTACLRLHDAKIVHNPDADRGQLSSLQTALATINTEAVLFSPVDYAHVRETTIQALAKGAPEMVLQPEFQSRHGHPVFARRPVIEALLKAPPDSPARDVIRLFPRKFIQVDDPGCVEDADDPAAFAALRERLA